MIYSASMVWAEYLTGNRSYYLLRQLVFFLLSIVSYSIFRRVSYNKLYKIATPFFLTSVALLIIVLIPFIGISKNGARSWIGIGDFSFQPSEIMKIAFILFTAKFCSKCDGAFDSIKPLSIFMLIVIAVFGLIMLEPDFGSGSILVLTIVIMMFKDLVPVKYISFGILLAGIFIAVLILIAPYRMDRITSYLNPWSDPLGTGFQIIQSLFAISPSGLFGYGLFNSKQKFYYLPEPQTDFIFAICVEELGMIGGIIIIFLFFSLIYIGYELCLSLKDKFAQNIVFGFTTLIFIQAFINIGVVIGLLPVTGVTLPFLSYGGSSLIITYSMMGIIVNIMESDAVEPSFLYYKKKKVRFRQHKEKKS